MTRFEVAAFPVVLAILHRALIALKYGTMSKQESRQFFTTPDYKEANQWLLETQMLTGKRTLAAEPAAPRPLA